MIRFGQRLAAVVAGSLLLLSVIGAAPAAAKAPSWSHKDAHVCGQPGAGQARCTSVARAFYVDGHAIPREDEVGARRAAAAAPGQLLPRADIRTAYGITAQGDPSRVIAIVDAYDDPDAFANLTRFRTDQGLPAIQSCSLATLTSLTSSAAQPLLHQDEPDRRHVAAAGGRRLGERDRPRSAGRLGRLPEVQHPAARSDLELGRESRRPR